MNTRATLGLTAGALVLGLIAGMVVGGGGERETKADGPGPTKSAAGVPLGYEHSKDGAASAALNYEAALVNAGPSGYRAVIEVAALPSKRDAIRESMRPGMELINTQLGEGAVVKSAILGYRVTSYHEDNAEVEIWEVGVFVAPNSAVPQAGWSTTTLQIQWSEGDWRLAGSPTTKNGPTPENPDSATETAKFIESIRPLSGVRYVAAT